MKLAIGLALLLLGTAHCARILGIFPTPSISHQVVFHALMKDLAARGHQLTILTTDLIKLENPNVTQIDFHQSYEVFRRKFNFVDFKTKKKTELDLFELFYDVMLDFLEEQLSHPEVKKLIAESSTRKFDLLIFEHLNYLPYLAFAELHDIPAIGIASLDTFSTVHEWIGNPVNPVVHPEFLFPYQHGALSLWQRWESIKFYLSMKYIVDPAQELKFEKLVQKHFPSVKTTIEGLRGRVQLMMSNSNPAMGFIRPLLPNTIQLGFMHIEPPKPLPSGELKAFLDNSKNGVIYMSLGSNVQSKDLSPEILQIFLKVFGSLSYDVLWKFEADNLPNKPDNVMINKWLPQSDLLAHPKIKVFITQGGQQSMEEAIDRTIPMVVIPFLADQDSNAQRLNKRKVGLHLELHTLTAHKLQNAINEMILPKYKENIKKLKELAYDQPQTSRERAVWWTEYILRHKGAKHLDYVGRRVPFYQQYWLDFIAIAVVSTIACIKFASVILNTHFAQKKTKKQ